jgi:hypothetical protein
MLVGHDKTDGGRLVPVVSRARVLNLPLQRTRNDILGILNHAHLDSTHSDTDGRTPALFHDSHGLPYGLLVIVRFSLESGSCKYFSERPSMTVKIS